MTDIEDTRALYFVRVSHRGNIVMGGHWLATDLDQARSLARAHFLRTTKPTDPTIDQCHFTASRSYAHPRNALNKETAYDD